MTLRPMSGQQLRPNRFLWIWLIIWFSGLLTEDLQAQFYNGSNMNFGKSRVQWSNTIWFYYRFDAFDTYFYLNGEELAQYTAQYAEKQLPLMARKLETSFTEKIQFIIFNSLADLKQSNIGLATEQTYNTGGITHIIGNKVFLYFDGNYLNFEKQIRAGLADVMVTQMMSGGNIGSQIRDAALFKLPDWYKNGLLSFLAEDWNTQYDSRLRDGITSGHYKKINRLQGEDAMIAGHSFWRYLEKTYSSAIIPQIVHLTQNGRDVQNGFLYATGLKYKNLVKEWLADNKLHFTGTEFIQPEKALPLKYRTYRSFTRPAISPDGRYLSYITSDEGRIKLWLMDLQNGKKKKMFKTGYSTDDKIDLSFPLTAWHPSGEILAFVLEEKGKTYLYFYTLAEKSTESRNLFDYQKVTHISYSADGKKLAMAAVRKGKPDIYVYDIPSNSHQQITNDYYTDLEPVFMQGNKLLVFSSNRTSDTLKVQTDPEEQGKTFDLFAYDLQTRIPVLKRLTDTPLANEKSPKQQKAGFIEYLSDRNGFYNLFSGRFDSTIAFVDTLVHYRYFMESEPRTGFTTNILYFTGSDFSEHQFVTAWHNDRQKLYRLTNNDFSSSGFGLRDSTEYMRQLFSDFQKRQKTPFAETVFQKRFRSVFRPIVPNDSLLPPPASQRQGSLVFTGRQRTALLNQGKEVTNQEKKAPPKRRNYLVEYFYDQLVTQIDFTYINHSYQPFSGGGSPIYLNPGFNAVMGVNLIDLLEDYRIGIGVRLNNSLINNEYALTFSNLKNRLDKQIVLHRQSVDETTENYYTRTHSHQAFYVLGWPLKETLTLKATAIYRNDMKVYLSVDQNSLKKKNEYENWGGLRGEVVFDDTKQVSLNLYTGMRWKLFGEYYQLVGKEMTNLVVLGFDLRHYQRLHRNFIWANRVAASTSFGKNKLIYYMGGVDNWLVPKFNRETPIDFARNYAYQTLATNMRGFHQNIRNGTNFVVLNSEFRFPVFSYFFHNPISSAFVRNFQLLAFGDAGTAWAGLNPYDPSNVLFTHYIKNGPFNVSVEQQKEPLVGGLGLGARTTILGYFVRADIAWGIEDGRFNKPVFYLSFNLDF